MEQEGEVMDKETMTPGTARPTAAAQQFCGGRPVGRHQPTNKPTNPTTKQEKPNEHSSK